MTSHANQDQLILFPDRCLLIKAVPAKNKRRFYALVDSGSKRRGTKVLKTLGGLEDGGRSLPAFFG